MAADAHHAIDAVWRIESPRLIASLTRLTHDLGAAEDLAQDALIAALEQWPRDGIPQNPGAWLTTVAKRRALDHYRRNAIGHRRYEELGRELAAKEMEPPDMGAALDAANQVEDDLLRLIFVCCHPVLSTEARAALTLRVLGGLTIPEIARAYLASEATIAQRIVRAKRTLAEKQIPFEVPQGVELTARLSSVLEVLYLIFNEGYSATAGDSWLRLALCEDALRMGRILAGLMPSEAEVHGLVALMEIQASRFAARVGPEGEPILMLEQNRVLWDQLLIRRGLAALETSQRARHAKNQAKHSGWFELQAAIAACHARARTAEETDWQEIVTLYGELVHLSPSPVVELNRAVAVAMASGPAAGLELVDAIRFEPALENYHLLPSVRGDLLQKLGRIDEARSEFERAANLARNSRERELLANRAKACSRSR
jgi:RNA polymerase sigma-70 factor (ECF subfamily)